MKKFVLVFAIAGAVALSASSTFSQESAEAPAKEGHGMMGGGMHRGSMMCPMMGMGGMGMMGGMMGGTGAGNPAMVGQVMQMRGEMMIKMGEVMMKYGKQIQEKESK